MEEGIAFPMILAILFAFYRTENPSKKRKVILYSALIGLFMAAISSYIRRIPNFVNRTSLSVYSIIPVLISFLVLLFLAIAKDFKKKNASLYENVFGTFLFLYTVSTLFYYLPNVILKIDTFVYYGESAVSSIVLFRVIGFCLAIILMLVSLFVIYGVAIQLSEAEQRLMVICSLLIVSITQINIVLNRLYSLKIIPKNPKLFSMIAWIMNNSRYFDFALMSILLIAPLILWANNIRIRETYNNKAELRKIKYNMMTRRNLAQFFILLMLVNILSLSVIKAYAGREVPLSAPEAYEIEDGHVVVGLDSLEDGHLHRYEYTASNGNKMRFILIKKAQGAYGVGLDACEICGPSGYFERKDEVVCKLCDVVMNKGTIGFKGGCNPIPIAYIVHDQKIKIDINTLEEKAYVFK